MVIIICQPDDGRNHFRRSGLRKSKWHMSNYTAEKYKKEIRFYRMHKGFSDLPANRRSEIQQEAQNVLLQYEQIYSKTDAIDIIRFLTEGLQNENRFKVQIAKLPVGTTGIVLANRDSFIRNTNVHNLITINSCLELEPNFRQRARMIIAHEYGHVRLHFLNGREPHFAHRDMEHRFDNDEMEAEYFARCLLMPERGVQQYLNLLKKNVGTASDQQNAELISRAFDVTMQKAYDRLLVDCVGKQ